MTFSGRYKGNMRSDPSACCRPIDRRHLLNAVGKLVCSDRTLVLGLGNSLPKDDAVGILVAHEVVRPLAGGADIVVREASAAGFGLLELLAGFRRALLIDAIRTPGGKPGTVYRLVPEDQPATERLKATHEMNLPTALAFGRALDLEMPE